MANNFLGPLSFAISCKACSDLVVNYSVSKFNSMSIFSVLVSLTH